MKVWENWGKLEKVSAQLNARKCFKTCYKCGKVWSKTGTVNVHMVLLIDNKKQITRFICDKCL